MAHLTTVSSRRAVHPKTILGYAATVIGGLTAFRVAYDVYERWFWRTLSELRDAGAVEFGPHGYDMTTVDVAIIVPMLAIPIAAAVAAGAATWIVRAGAALETALAVFVLIILAFVGLDVGSPLQHALSSAGESAAYYGGVADRLARMLRSAPPMRSAPSSSHAGSPFAGTGPEPGPANPHERPPRCDRRRLPSTGGA